jgi:hypothetical protein
LRSDVERHVDIGQSGGELFYLAEGGAEFDALVAVRGVRRGPDAGRYVFRGRDQVSSSWPIATQLSQGLLIDRLDGADLTTAVFVDIDGNVRLEAPGRHRGEDGDQHHQTAHVVEGTCRATHLTPGR